MIGNKSVKNSEAFRLGHTTVNQETLRHYNIIFKNKHFTRVSQESDKIITFSCTVSFICLFQIYISKY